MLIHEAAAPHRTASMRGERERDFVIMARFEGGMRESKGGVRTKRASEIGIFIHTKIT
jgi:hypothetical protein